MSSEQILLAMTAVLAVVALAAAFIAVRAARRIQPAAEFSAGSPQPASTEIVCAPQDAPMAWADEVAVPKIVDGRVIVPPTTRQIVDATMGKPLVRVSVLSHGVAHALRPESRDRIVAMMRREFRSRRRQRKLAAKQAARLANPTPPRMVDRPAPHVAISSEAWLGELPATPHPASSTRPASSNGVVE